MKNVKFIKEMEELIYKPDRTIDTYYQICKFKHPESHLYQTRKIFFNEKGKILKIFEKDYDSNTIKKFLKDAKVNKYKMYPTNSIDNISMPNASDMTLVQSSLINDKAQNYGLDKTYIQSSLINNKTTNPELIDREWSNKGQNNKGQNNKGWSNKGWNNNELFGAPVT